LPPLPCPHQGLEAAHKARKAKADKKASLKKSRIENLAKARATKAKEAK
jgi:hypothetical protein